MKFAIINGREKRKPTNAADLGVMKLLYQSSNM